MRRSRLSGIALAALIAASPATAAVVLQYHHVGESTPASTSITPERFAMHLEALAESDFEIVRLQDLVDALRQGRPLPDRVAAITFDDGYRSIYDNAWPMLKAKRWPFTVFVNPEPHDRGSAPYMSWDQLRELQAGGATIANHSFSHARLAERPANGDEAAWRSRVRGEITRAAQRIREETGASPALFAWPFGEFDAALLEILDGLGYTGFGQQSGPLAAWSDPRALPRFPFGGAYGDRDDFLAKLNSLPMPLAAGADALRLETGDGQPLRDVVLNGPARPVLWLELAGGTDPTRLACFVSGQGRADIAIEGQRVRVQAARPLGRGASRYNCTLPGSVAGRYHWFSQPWFVH